MSNDKSFVELETQFDDAMATIFSLYELMQNANVSAEYKRETFKMIGRGGYSSAKKAEKAFHTLMGLYLDEQQDIKRYKVKPDQAEQLDKGPMVERAVNLVEGIKTKHTKQ